MDAFSFIVLLLAWAVGLVLLYVIIKAAVLAAPRQHADDERRAAAPAPAPTHMDADGL